MQDHTATETGSAGAAASSGAAASAGSSSVSGPGADAAAEASVAAGAAASCSPACSRALAGVAGAAGPCGSTGSSSVLGAVRVLHWLLPSQATCRKQACQHKSKLARLLSMRGQALACRAAGERHGKIGAPARACWHPGSGGQRLTVSAGTPKTRCSSPRRAAAGSPPGARSCGQGSLFSVYGLPALNNPAVQRCKANLCVMSRVTRGLHSRLTAAWAILGTATWVSTVP